LKTKIITLESHDDLISVRDQLSWAKTQRILLMWPKYEDVGLRALDLKVLQRHAGSLGAQLGLVTRRGSIRRAAEALGIPVFASAGAAQRESWPERPRGSGRAWQSPRRDLRRIRTELRQVESHWHSNVWTRVTAFVAGVAAVLSLVGVFLPRASIILYPETQTQDLMVRLQASPPNAASPAAGVVLLRELTVEVGVVKQMTVTGQILLAQSKARGLVAFANLTDDPISIPAGTVVFGQTNGLVRFATQEVTEVPRGVGETVPVSVEAVAAGAAGNVDAGEIRALEGPLGLVASVHNPEPTSGGTDVSATGPSDADREMLHRLVLDELLRTAEEEMHVLLGERDVLVKDTIRPAEASEEIYDPAPGRAGRTLQLSVRGEYTASYLASADLLPVAVAAVDGSMPAGFVAREAPEVMVENLRTDADGAVRFDLRVRRVLYPQLDSARVFSTVQGRRIRSAEQNLQAEIGSRKPAEVQIQPSWWPWMPLIPFSLRLTSE
jgi:hypothetical protein